MHRSNLFSKINLKIESIARTKSFQMVKDQRCVENGDGTKQSKFPAIGIIINLSLKRLREYQKKFNFCMEL